MSAIMMTKMLERVIRRRGVKPEPAEQPGEERVEIIEEQKGDPDASGKQRQKHPPGPWPNERPRAPARDEAADSENQTAQIRKLPSALHSARRTSPGQPREQAREGKKVTGSRSFIAREKSGRARTIATSSAGSTSSSVRHQVVERLFHRRVARAALRPPAMKRRARHDFVMMKRGPPDEERIDRRLRDERENEGPVRQPNDFAKKPRLALRDAGDRAIALDGNDLARAQGVEQFERQRHARRCCRRP